MRHRAQNGFTLIEMLVALTASLILFGAVMTIFQMLGDAVGRTRHLSQLDKQLCQIVSVLRRDLNGTTTNRNTAGLVCPVDAAAANGYFEIIEGPSSDLHTFNRNSNPKVTAKAKNETFERVVGDTDDMLFFTTTSTDAGGFVGKYGTMTVEADDAEIAYFCRPTPNTSNPTLYTLYRRQLLIGPPTNDPPFAAGSSPPRFSQWTGQWDEFYQNYDLSVHRQLNALDNLNDDVLIPNTLADLQRRRNRLGHDNASLPAPLAIAPLDPLSNALVLTGARTNEDVVAKNVLAFDIKVLDLNAERRRDPAAPPTTLLEPGDRDYFRTDLVAPSTALTYGDLGFSNLCYTAEDGTPVDFPVNPSSFSGNGTPNSVLEAPPGPDHRPRFFARTYDTWSTAYTSNNIDDDGIGGADNVTEEPPYPTPLPGIKIRIRLYDEATQEISQHTVVYDFRE